MLCRTVFASQWTASAVEQEPQHVSSFQVASSQRARPSRSLFERILPPVEQANSLGSHATGDKPYSVETLRDLPFPVAAHSPLLSRAPPQTSVDKRRSNNRVLLNA